MKVLDDALFEGDGKTIKDKIITALSAFSLIQGHDTLESHIKSGKRLSIIVEPFEDFITIQSQLEEI